MSAENQEREELKALRQRIEDLRIVIAKNDDGGFTVASFSEPLFCFDRGSLDEITLLIEDTLRSYAKTFYQIDDVKVSVKRAPIETPKIPIRVFEPEFSVRTSFGGFSSHGIRYGIANAVGTDSFRPPC